MWSSCLACSAPDILCPAPSPPLPLPPPHCSGPCRTDFPRRAHPLLRYLSPAVLPARCATSPQLRPPLATNRPRPPSRPPTPPGVPLASFPPLPCSSTAHQVAASALAIVPEHLCHVAAAQHKLVATQLVKHPAVQVLLHGRSRGMRRQVSEEGNV